MGIAVKIELAKPASKPDFVTFTSAPDKPGLELPPICQVYTNAPLAFVLPVKVFVVMMRTRLSEIDASLTVSDFSGQSLPELWKFLILFW